MRNQDPITMPMSVGLIMARMLNSGIPHPHGRGLEYHQDFHRTIRALYAGQLLIVRRDTSVNPPNIKIRLVNPKPA